jgi:hypothetical protein
VGEPILPARSADLAVTAPSLGRVRAV